MTFSEHLAAERPVAAEIARRLTGLEIGARRIPASLLRAMGRAGDLFGRVTGRLPELTGEAAEVLTRSVPIDDSRARGFLGRDPIPMEQSFRDLYRWLFDAGILEADHVGRIALPR